MPKSYAQLKTEAASLLNLAVAYAKDGAVSTAIDKAKKAISVLKLAEKAKAVMMRASQ